MGQKTDREILWDIEDAWETVKDGYGVELNPKAIDWLIRKVKEGNGWV